MPKKVRLPIVLLLAFALALGLAGASGSAKVAFEPWGPHVDEIIMPIIKEAEALRIAFERGESVVWTGLTRPEDIDRAKVLSNTELTMTLGFHMFYLCFNMREEPLANQPLRQAVAHCTDRDNIIRTLFKGYMLPMTSFIPQVSPFYKADVPVYPFSHAKAAEVLDKAGYTLDPVTKVRIDPKTGKPLREMKIFTPTYEVAPTSAELGKMIADSCQKVGLPVVPEPMDFPVMLDKLDIGEFDMYCLAWSLSRIPTSLYSFFHTSQDVEAGYNRPGIRNPELDKHLEDLNWAPDLDTAQKASDAAQLILAREMPYVPLYSRPYIDAFRTDLVTGYVPMKGFGAASYNNMWTVLNIRRVDRRGNPIEGGTIRWSLQEEPKNLNPCVASSAYEWEVLSRLYDGLQQMHPDTLEDMPWMAHKWDVGTWEPEPGKKATTVTWYINKGIKWSDGMPFTAEDIKFTMDYLKEHQIPRYKPTTDEVVKVELIDRYTVKLYYREISYWNLYRVDSFLPKHIWQDVTDWKAFEPWKEPHPRIKGFTKLVGHGPYILKEYVPGEYVRLVKNPNYWRLNP